MTLVGATVASVWGDIFHHPDDEVVLDDTLACVRWMYSEWDGLSGWADEPVKTCRYLILVVPGARLGSVSLASVWKCSVYTFLPSRNIS